MSLEAYIKEYQLEKICPPSPHSERDGEERTEEGTREVQQGGH